MTSKASSRRASPQGWGFQSISDDDPDRDLKFHNRLTGKEPGLLAMGGPYGFAIFERAPDWWKKKQIRAARKILDKQGPPEVLLHPQVWNHINTLKG